MKLKDVLDDIEKVYENLDFHTKYAAGFIQLEGYPAGTLCPLITALTKLELISDLERVYCELLIEKYKKLDEQRTKITSLWLTKEMRRSCFEAIRDFLEKRAVGNDRYKGR